MKLVIDRSTLLPALQRAARVAPGRGTIPILGHCLIEARKTRLSITATDMDRAITVALDAQVEVAGSTTADVRLLSQFVAGLADGLQVELQAADGHLTVRAGRARAKFRTLEAADFPQMVAPGETAALALEGQAFARLLGSVAHAQSSEETRYYLNGVYLHRRAARELVAVTTDGHMLARSVLAVAEDLPEFAGIIVPRETVVELAALAEDAGTLQLEIGATVLRAAAGDTVLTSKLVDGTFPDYERVIPPADIATGFEVAREDLARAVKRVGVFVTGSEKSKPRPVKLTPAGQALALHAISDELGEISDEIDAHTTTKAPIGLNARYLLATLESLTGKDIRIRYADQLSPAVFTDPADPTQLRIVVPRNL